MTFPQFLKLESLGIFKSSNVFFELFISFFIQDKLEVFSQVPGYSISSLAILAWLYQFSLFSILATSFSISITHLSESIQSLYSAFSIPLKRFIIRNTYQINESEIEIALNKLNRELKQAGGEVTIHITAKDISSEVTSKLSQHDIS